MLSQTHCYDILPCSESDFYDVQNYISLLQLDNNDLHQNQFLVAKKEGRVIGFGRLRTYGNCQELCSLGVIEPYRNKGAGTALSEELIKKSKLPLYVVTIIPGFFTRLGFVEVEEFPSDIGVKMSYCTDSLPVPETYVAMRYK